MSDPAPPRSDPSSAEQVEPVEGIEGVERVEGSAPAEPVDVRGPRMVVPPRDGATVPPASVEAAPKVVRRGRRRPATSTTSLSSPLLSGRSLAPQTPRRRWSFIREHRAIVVSVLALVLIVATIVLGKVMAEGAADSATEARADEITTLLDGATPEEFLAFNAGVKTPGSLAVRVRDEPGFVNVKAVADLSFIRFQPTGWWAGFTERCIVAAVRPDGVTVTVPKTACIRVPVPER